MAAVKINAADVDIIANELEVTSSTDCSSIRLEDFISLNRILIYFLIVSNSWT